jgi:hypothetical protein
MHPQPVPDHCLSLLELKVRHVIASIDQPHDELAARASPTGVCLPDIGVLIRAGIIRQAASARRDGLIDGIRRGGAAVDLLGAGIARGENVQPLVPVQTKFHWNALPGLDHVQHRRVADGWEETGEGGV